jgi:hypothetical protein
MIFATRVKLLVAGVGILAVGTAWEILEYLEGGWPTGFGFILIGIAALIALIALIWPKTHDCRGFEVVPAQQAKRSSESKHGPQETMGSGED